MKTINLKIAGCSTYYSKMLKYFTIEKGKILRNKYNIALYDGPNICKWNGGRINSEIYFTSKEIKIFNKIGIGIFYTFSNSVIDLYDPIGNQMLDDLNINPINGTIIVNKDLTNKIRKNYNIKTCYSITGHDLIAEPVNKTIDKYIEYYKHLENNYEIIVPKMEHVFQSWFLNNLNLDKYELMTNDTCVYNCVSWKDHFEKINEINRNHDINYIKSNIKAMNCVSECWLKNFNPTEQSNNNLEHLSMNGMDFNIDTLKYAISLGYSNFKISGRENTFESIIEDIGIFYDC